MARNTKSKQTDIKPPFAGLGMKVCGYPSKDMANLAKANQKAEYLAIESFSGAGGMTQGLEWAGFNVALSFDYNEAAIASHTASLSSKAIVADARKVTGDILRKEAGISKETELALFTGGPPCQGFSKQTRGAHNGDVRNDLVLEFARMVKELSPRFFLFENVAIFGQKRGLEYIAEIRRSLSDYELHPHFYNASDYGLPQTRQRFVMVGQRKDQRFTFSVPPPTVKKKRTVGDVLYGLPEPPEDYSVHPDFWNHQNARVTSINIERFSHVPQGGGWQDIPYDLRLPCHKKVKTSTGGWPDVYGRLQWDGYCPTITGGFDSFTRGRYGHPLFNRPLTPREAARIQGFPDSFQFKGTRGDIRLQIGNAVPPPLAEAVGLGIAHGLLCHDRLIEPLASLLPTAEQLRLSLDGTLG
jgi:DNA (cytosine-5)-methyltransferase 1